MNVSGYGLLKINLFIRYQYTMEKINKVGWIGIGRMGLPMVKKILEAGFKVTIWNRTRSKAEALAEYGAEIVDAPVDLATVDVLFTMVSTGLDLEQVYFGQKGVMTGKESPQILVDRSEEHTSELQSQAYLVCRLLLEKKKKYKQIKLKF